MSRVNTWRDPAAQIADMRERLADAREALKSDPQYRQASAERCEALLCEAETQIKHAAGLLERHELKGPAFIAFRACLRLAFRDMQMALIDPAVNIGTGRWLHQKQAGEKRWGDSDSGDPRGRALDAIITRLLRNRPDEPVADLYDEFCADCAAEGLTPPREKTFTNRASKIPKSR